MDGLMAHSPGRRVFSQETAHLVPGAPRPCPPLAQRAGLTGGPDVFIMALKTRRAPAPALPETPLGCSDVSQVKDPEPPAVPAHESPCHLDISINNAQPLRGLPRRLQTTLLPTSRPRSAPGHVPGTSHLGKNQ